MSWAWRPSHVGRARYGPIFSGNARKWAMSRLISMVQGVARRPLARPISRILERRMRFQANLIPISESRPEDVFIAGYPKSGNTWVQNLLVGVVYGAAPSRVPDTLVQDLVPDVHSRSWYRRYGRLMFFKTHHLPRPEYRRVVYLLRDGRDVMVSYWHHREAL